MQPKVTAYYVVLSKIALCYTVITLSTLLSLLYPNSLPFSVCSESV